MTIVDYNIVICYDIVDCDIVMTIFDYDIGMIIVDYEIVMI